MSVQTLLAAAGVSYKKFAGWPTGGVFLTAANQLLGTFSDLKRFQFANKDYLGWHAHHIVESQDLE